MYHEFELGLGADIIVRELFRLQPEETLLITADTEAHPEVVNAVARAAFTVGGKPLVLWHSTPLGKYKGVGKTLLPHEALTGAMLKADAWCEFNHVGLLYTTPYDIAMRDNKNLRHLCVTGMDADMMTRLIARVDYKTLDAFQDKVVDMMRKADHVHQTSEAGCDIEFDNDPNLPIISEKGDAYKPGSHMMPGQIGWAPKFDSINGKIVVDGSISRPINGIPTNPITIYVENGTIAKCEGGDAGPKFDRWLRSFDDPQMLRIAHATLGFHPNARLSGTIVEDERIWGAFVWGIGNVGPMLYPPTGIDGLSHSDVICLRTSVWLDDEQITSKGQVVHKDLVDIAAKLTG